MFAGMQGLFWVDILTYGIFGTGPKISPWPSAMAQFYGQSLKSLMQQIRYCDTRMDCYFGRCSYDVGNAGVG